MSLVSVHDLIQAAIAGEVVSFPTDTVPALAVQPSQCSRIYQLKQRSLDKPLILMAAQISQILPYLEGKEAELEQWQGLMGQYWPGALTLVLPASELLPPSLNPRGDRTIGVRIPQSAIALEILSQTGPLATTSANVSGSPALERLSEITKTFPTVVCLDGDRSLGSGQPSTVLQWQDCGWRILRQGSINVRV